MLIGIVGFIGSGKGTVGDIIQNNFDFIQDSFAKPLKDAISYIFGWDRTLIEGATKESRQWREIPDPFWSKEFGYDFSPRLALQLMGTEAGRDVFHKDIWVISLLHRTQGKNVIITDVRFKNEIRLIHEHGGRIVRVKRGQDPIWFDIAAKANAGDTDALSQMKELGVHRSEWDWIGCKIDATIENDTTIKDLETKVTNWIHYIPSKTV